MVMRINEARTDNLIRAVDHLNPSLRLDTLRNLRNLPALDQNVSLGRHNVILRIVDKRSAVLEYDALLNHCYPFREVVL